MIRPTDRHLAALAGLRQNADLLDYLRLSQADCYKNLASQKDEVLLRQTQGQAQAVSTILELIDSAPGILSRKA
jgi:hypothetical protein